MTTVRWTTPGTASSNLAGTALDGLGNGATSAFLTTYANGTNLDLYAGLLINLGSISPATGGSITVRVFASVNGTVPDNTGSVGGGDAYTIMLTTTASAKVVTLPLIRLYPGPVYFTVTNNSGVALASSGNSFIVVPFDEAAN